MTLTCDHFHVPRPDNKIKITVLNSVGHPVKPTQTYDTGEDVVDQWTYSPGQIWPYDTSMSLKVPNA